MICQIAAANEVEIISGAVSSHHVYVSIPSSLSVSKFVQFVKGASSRKLQLEFEDLRRGYWSQHIWARGYFVAAAGNVTAEMVREYIRRQGTNEEQGNEFRITNPTYGFSRLFKLSLKSVSG